MVVVVGGVASERAMDGQQVYAVAISLSWLDVAIERFRKRLLD